MQNKLLSFIFLLIIFILFFLPTNAQNFWTSTNGPYAGSVRSLAINSNNQIFAGTNGSGIYRSTDNGNSWTQLSNAMNYSKVYAIEINSNGVVFAGTLGEGIFRSTDNGNTWIQINSGLSNLSIYAITISN
jgi:photosystem II stability/assembly factor-like uncharacterized protein